jgi:hypothetical protein
MHWIRDIVPAILLGIVMAVISSFDLWPIEYEVIFGRGDGQPVSFHERRYDSLECSISYVVQPIAYAP